MSAARIWLLASPRLGELAQQRRLAAALAEPVVEKPVFAEGAALKPHFGWTPAMAQRSGLCAPWPQLVISFGKTLNAALWVRAASGGQTRIVHLGRPRGVALSALDLLMPMPQDAVPDAPNVLRLRLPLNAPPAVCESVRRAAQQRLSALPRPWTLLVIGGSTPHLQLPLPVLTTVIAQLGQQMAVSGGSTLVVTSPRTPKAWLVPLQAALIQQRLPYEFSAYSSDADSNRYAEYLALADTLVLTGDTASMIADSYRSGRPVRIVRLKPSLLLRLKRQVRALLPAALAALLIRRGLWVPAVDLDQWIESLVQAGLVGEFGSSLPSQCWTPQADDDLRRAVQRIRALLR